MSSLRRTMSKMVNYPIEGEKHPIWMFIRNHVIWMMVLVAYSFFGAAILEKLEITFEKKGRNEVLNFRKSMAISLWNSARNSSNNSSKWVEQFFKELSSYDKYYKDRIQPAVNSIDDDNYAWEFWGAMLFCGTIYTTIGYGYIAPKTVGGRIFSMFYAVFGIPLCLIVLANLGKLFTDGLNKLWIYFSDCFKKKKNIKGNLKSELSIINVNMLPQQSHQFEDDESIGDYNKDIGHITNSTHKQKNITPSFHNKSIKPKRTFEERKRSVIISIFLVIIYILIGAGIYTSWENWEYFEAIYFIFISLTTVGLGDIFPNHPKFFILSSFYIFFGLALVSMVVNLIMINTKKKVEKNLKSISNKVEKKVVAIQLNELATNNFEKNYKKKKLLKPVLSNP